MSDFQVEAFRDIPTGTAAGLKVNLGADNDVTITTGEYMDVNTVANAASVASAAVILTYNPTAGKTAVVTGVSAFSASATAEIDVVLVTGGVDITIARWNAAQMDGQTAFMPLAVALEDGDVLELEVTTVHAANTADVAIFAIEQR